ncbi:plastin-3-like [Lytechinus variegatus]|uniref:plastin-3-like n=1 Tax=Lytechinus variegatus TaxID=7654 RepID=UPI001BB17321|nr:plastin-3-like [Lytechinus variegatus]XP_041466940.1 plastin-3-like [Lytechinus variegatus]XP_041466941.1 plastin-3-like [Lytechinus variegatus]
MDDIEEIREIFNQMDLNRDGFLTDKEIQEILQAKGESFPAYKCRDFIREYDTDKNGSLTFDEFMKLYDDIKKNKVSSGFLTQVKARVGIQAEKGTSEVSAAGTTHSFSKEETAAFTRYINDGLNLTNDPALASKLPISVESGLFEAVVDGILLCKMINSSVPNTIDERVITTTKLNKFTQLENLTLALNSAKAIGCSVINIDPMDIQNKTKHLVLGLVWQIIRIGLFANIDLQFRPELILLLNEGETLDDLKKLSPEELLIRWVNYHLEQDGSTRRIKNFSEDIKDSEVYYCLMRQIAPKDIELSYTHMNRPSMDSRAEEVLNNAELLDCRAFVTPKDIVSGNSKLNMAFVANLFNHHHGLVPSEEMEYENVEETREEKTYRNWMNSLNVKPYVNHLYSDLSNGLVLLELFDIVNPGIVNWEKVNRPPYKMAAKMKKIENCNYCVELGRKMNFSLVGIGGQDICDGTVTLTLAVVWQLLRAYTLRMLQEINQSDKPLSDQQIVSWANTKLEEAGKSSKINSFKDPRIADSLPILDLVDAIKPSSVRYDLYIDPRTGENGEERDSIRMKNAQYTISIARKHGAMVYALPDDIVEVNPKMVMTIFACLMALDRAITNRSS